jgi:hypothetical protein
VARDFVPWIDQDVKVPLPNPRPPRGPVVPRDEGAVRAALATALNDRPALGPTESVVIPREVQQLIGQMEAQRMPSAERFDVDTAEEQAARAGARAVEQTWATAVAALRRLYAEGGRRYRRARARGPAHDNERSRHMSTSGVGRSEEASGCAGPDERWVAALVPPIGTARACQECSRPMSWWHCAEISALERQARARTPSAPLPVVGAATVAPHWPCWTWTPCKRP